VKAWFEALDDRERALVLTAGILIVFAVFWFGIWTPLDSGQQSVSARVEVWKESLAELRPLKGQIQANASDQNSIAADDQSLIVIVDNTLRQRGLNNALQRSQPTPAGDGIRVEFESVSFDDLMLWLGDVNRQFGLQVQSGNFSIASGDFPGRVNSSLTLQR
jgi:general secretion pathway protein M